MYSKSQEGTKIIIIKVYTFNRTKMRYNFFVDDLSFDFDFPEC